MFTFSRQFYFINNTSFFTYFFIRSVWDFIGVEEPMIKFHLFEQQKKEIYEKAKLQLKKIGVFIFDKEVPLKECKEMEPLKTRTPGEVQTPLKHCK